MKRNHFYTISAILLSTIFCINNLNAQCCMPPDSLKVKNITDSSFCGKWLVNDSLHCDSARAFQIQYRPVGTNTWTTVLQFYNHDVSYLFCDTASPCTKYQWRVRNACSHNGDTLLTDWVNGPKFTTTGCDSGKSHINASLNTQAQNAAIAVKPNPVRNDVLLSGYFKGPVKITITNINGKKMYEKSVNTQNGKLNFPINVTDFDKGIYFLNVVDNTSVLKSIFIKE